ncbi:MAG: hydroxymethylglutaryl-CoA reductase, degradative [Candidatus Thermoplasmatota archaeon]|nr:hydroxymethylglutaryl-CoA reductase, degradative [Candidatus Thermoplasmatota archaeon]
MPTSRLPGFYKLSLDERIQRLQAEGALDDARTKALLNSVPLSELDDLSENVVGRFELPLSVATNFVVNGREILVPMTTEESSVVAAASHGAKAALAKGGFHATGGEPRMIAQVHLVDVDAYQAHAQILAVREEILEALIDPEDSMQKRGGGPLGLEAYIHHMEDGTEFLTVHLIADVRDAMGANYVNTLAEELAPHLAEITGARPVLRILSNLATKRLTRVEATFDAGTLGGEQVVEDIVLANRIATADAHRACTHNKGVLNGITAVTLATGNDTRAVEAACHAYAVRTGQYRALTRYEVTETGDLHGVLEVPLALGMVGGATRVHPQARAAVGLMEVTTSQELCHVAASVGLAQNVAALRALVAEGIQAGHMSLHAVNLARQAGVPAGLVDEVAERMVDEGTVSQSAAVRIAKELGARFE